MKRILALLVALLLLASVPAFAEDQLYVRQLPQYTYRSEFLLNQEAYPEVCISPYYAYKFFTSYDPVEPTFLCFAAPAGAMPNEFDIDSATYLDVDNAIQYSYQVTESASYEEFINKAEQDEYIIRDGADSMAAYVEPDRLRAFGMIGTREFGKSSKLIITMQMDAMSTKMPLEKRVSELSAAIETEMDRIRAAMRMETKAPFWSADKFAGVKFLDEDDYSYQLKFDFPVLTCTYADGSVKDARAMVTRLKYGTLRAVYNFGEGSYVEMEVEMDDYCYAQHKLEEGDPDAQQVTLESGNTWTIYMSGLTERQKSSYVYASLPLMTKTRYGSEYVYYLNVHMDANNIYWTSVEDYVSDVAMYDTAFEVMNFEDDPYVPAEVPVTETPVEEPAGEMPVNEDGSWICPSCGTENTGKFCTECGTGKPQPESGEWICPNCETANTGKFCSECGTAKPAD